MPSPEYRYLTEAIYQEAARENAERPFHIMAGNAAAANMPDISQTLKAMADYYGSVHSEFNGDDPLTGFVDSVHGENVPLGHLPFVETGFAAAAAYRANDLQEQVTILHRQGSQFSPDKREKVEITVGKMIAMLGLDGKTINEARQGPIRIDRYPTKMGFDVVTRYSDVDVSVQLAPKPRIPVAGM